MRFNLFIDCDAPAFGDNDNARALETARILQDIARRLLTVNARGDYTDARGGWTGHYQTILDADGNDVGRYAFKPKGQA
jgi:hypothetical protein